MITENKIRLDTIKIPMEAIIAETGNSEKSKKLTIGLHVDRTTGKITGFKFYVYSGGGIVMADENFKLVINRYNALKVEPEAVEEEVMEEEVTLSTDEPTVDAPPPGIFEEYKTDTDV